MSGLILYRTEDGQAEVSLRALDGSVWLSQLQMAELFATSVPNVSIHIRNLLKEGELSAEAVIKESLITAADGKPYRTKLYRLEMVLAVGYRVRSPRGTQFRQWATRHLAEYLVKGFVMDDERLKNPGGWDYFDELLARIREIRASEKRFYQKVRDLFALSVDYQDHEQQAQLFFAEVQNKLLYAVTQKTAAELVVARADPGRPNMALQSFSGSRVRKADVIVAKNYLNADEIDTLNRLVVIFLEQAELRVKDRQPLTLDYWRNNVDKLLAFNDRPILQGPGSMSHAAMKVIAHERYENFDAQRRADEAREADAQDIRELEAVEKELEAAGKGKKG
jgi:hypothetical protein